MSRPHGWSSMERSTAGTPLHAIAWLTLVSFLIVGCGDGDDGGTATGAGDGAAYCEQVEVLESQESRPTDEQLDELVAVAPTEIRADVERFADAIRNDDMEAEGVGEAESRILAWEEENCS